MATRARRPMVRFVRPFTRSLLAVIATMGCIQGALAPGVAAQPAPDLHVSPQGKDTWSGLREEPDAAGTDGPVATLERARDLVRELKAREPGRDRPIVVSIRGGTYHLAAPWILGPQDSGTERAPIIYQARAGERPVLSAGVAIRGWTVDGQGRWQVDLPEVREKKWSFAQLFVNDQRRFRPRLPESGYHTIAREVAPSPGAAGKGNDGFGYAGEDLRADWYDLSSVEVLSFHEWSASRMRIGKIDGETRTVTFAGHTQGQDWWAKYLQGHRFLAINVREALDAPGEWYLDVPAGRLTYIPLPGEDPTTARVVAPRLDEALVLAGDGAERKWVEHIQMRGLTFAHTNWVLPPQGQAFPQAEIGLGAAVVAVAARNIAFERCAIRNTGAYAMAFGPGCRHNRVEGCELVDLGAGGVKLGHAGTGSWGDVHRLPQGDEAVVSHHVVRDCTIAHGGRLHPAAIGVWIGQSHDNRIEHNDIHDFYYTALSVGWTWGYGTSLAHHNDIGFNHVYDIGQKVLSDMGAIYTLGVSPGTTVHDNHFHDVKSFSYGGWGLYTDEGSTGIVLENNLVYRCSKGGFHQHYGRENIVRNNILAFAEEQQVQRTRTEEHLSFTFERNIVYWDNDSPLLGSNWKDNNFRLDYNLYWNAAKKPVLFPGGLSLDAWRAERKQDEHSLVADPRFVDPAKDDFHLLPDSPALGLGFKPFDYTRAGRTTPLELTKDLPPVPRGFE